MKTVVAATTICLIAIFCLSGRVMADEAQPAMPVAPAQAQSSVGDIQGDNAIFIFQKTGKIFCVYPDSQDGKCNNPLFAAQDTEIHIRKIDPASGFDIVTVSEAKGCGPKRAGCIKKDDGNLYIVEGKRMFFYPYKHNGFAWGMLSVPYKYHTGSGQFTSEASGGDYLGYTPDFNFIGALTLLASVGFTPCRSIPYKAAQQIPTT